jgi:preprotein translocase subunit SecA
MQNPNKSLAHAPSTVRLITRTVNDVLSGPWLRGEAKVGRNELCRCGSGRKHKRCCGAARVEASA